VTLEFITVILLLIVYNPHYISSKRIPLFPNVNLDELVFRYRQWEAKTCVDKAAGLNDWASCKSTMPTVQNLDRKFFNFLL